MINLIQKLFYKYERFIKFAIVGFGNLFVSLLTYYILIYFSINYQIANIGGFITGSLNGYIWNRIWVFKNSKKNREPCRLRLSSYILPSLLKASLTSLRMFSLSYADLLRT